MSSGNTGNTGNTGNAGGQAGQGVGDAIKGVFNTAGGAGESIRGNFNNFVDQAGEGLASRMGSGEEQQQRAEKLDSSNSGAKPGENAEIAQKGEDQFKQGLEQMTGRK
ncbi:unnamed protein product [Jaminaea pallidilutea]